MPHSVVASVHIRYLRAGSVKPSACTALIVALKLVIEPAGTVTFRTCARQPVPDGFGWVTKRTCRTPPVTAAERLITSSTPAAHSWNEDCSVAYRFVFPASTTYSGCTRKPLVPSPSQETSGELAATEAGAATPAS
jgi:hypothetical protein